MANPAHSFRFHSILSHHASFISHFLFQIKYFLISFIFFLFSSSFIYFNPSFYFGFFYFLSFFFLLFSFSYFIAGQNAVFTIGCPNMPTSYPSHTPIQQKKWQHYLLKKSYGYMGSRDPLFRIGTGSLSATFGKNCSRLLARHSNLVLVITRRRMAKQK